MVQLLAITSVVLVLMVESTVSGSLRAVRSSLSPYWPP